MTNKRDLVLSLFDSSQSPAYTPAAFFLHFDPQYRAGDAAVKKHMEYFHYTDMDFVKIQYEQVFPHLSNIQKPEDWAKMPFYGLDFYEPQLRAVEGLVKAARPEALVIQTLYSPFMCAGHTTSGEMVTQHIKENPEAVQRGMQIITDSLMGFVKECIRLGIDGFYTSTQGGEQGRFDNPVLFDACVRPYDLALMEEANHACSFNILHVCDYVMPYSQAGLQRFVDYPGQIVNASLDLSTGKITAQDVGLMFNRPFMGGMDRLGVIANGNAEQIRNAAEEALDKAEERTILGADCTVPGSTSWDNLRTAIDTAHHYQRR